MLKKVVLLCSYLVFFGFLTLLVFFFSPAALFVPLLMIVVALTALLVFLTWRFVCVEYEVIIAGGDILFTAIYGKGFRKKILYMPVNAFSEIGEYDDTAYEEISKLSLKKNHIVISSLSAPDVYYALFEEDKDQCIIYFDAPPRAVELLKKLNSSAFRASAKRISTKKGCSQ
ncbi:MAG: hypothetical protein IJY39_11885 [Clostridia bacterium]|nr:hypothetical protein [Clostridia bacterium]